MRFGAHAGRSKITWTLALSVTCIAFAGVAPSQSATRSAPVTSAPSNSSGSLPGYSDPNPLTRAGIDVLREDDPNIRVKRENARRDEIKKRMEQNATRLLQLTAELRNDLQTRELTEADSKRLDEIAKLAHTVREQMKQ